MMRNPDLCDAGFRIDKSVNKDNLICGLENPLLFRGFWALL